PNKCPPPCGTGRQSRAKTVRAKLALFYSCAPPRASQFFHVAPVSSRLVEVGIPAHRLFLAFKKQTANLLAFFTSIAHRRHAAASIREKCSAPQAECTDRPKKPVW
ncbi:MAG: hypothetical protein ACREJ2_04960, partial [Planctomycetota bacterium]